MTKKFYGGCPSIQFIWLDIKKALREVIKHVVTSNLRSVLHYHWMHFNHQRSA